MNVEEEIQKLEEEIHRLGSLQTDGSYKVSFSFSVDFPEYRICIIINPHTLIEKSPIALSFSDLKSLYKILTIG